MGIAFVVPGADYRERNLGTAHPSTALPIEGIAILGASYVAAVGRYTAAVYPIFTSQRNLLWSIVSGSEYASIDQNGVVTALPGASSSQVRIRCESVDNPNISSERTISVTAGVFEFFDWLQSDGTDYFLIKTILNLWKHTLTAIGTFPNSNGYLFGVRYASNSTHARAAAYRNSSNRLAVCLGKRGFTATTIVPSGVYKIVLKCSTDASTTDASAKVFDSDGTELASFHGGLNDVMTFSGVLSVFALGSGNTIEEWVLASGTISTGKFYGLQLQDADGIIILDLKPITLDGTPALIDTISGIVYQSVVGGGITAGND